jgi:monofunctional biosynthetic peptidoglycan transglycosylase
MGGAMGVRWRARGWAARLRRWALWLVGGFVLLSVAWVLLYAVVAPPVTPLMLIRALGGAGIHRSWVPAAAIDPDVFRAVMAGEDNLFCEHHGFDFQAIRQAWRNNQRGGRTLGGSTITMQTAKNLFLWPGRSLVRKGFEAYFTVLLELFLTKRRILVLYLNTVEWGGGVYGIEAAAETQFHKSAAALSQHEAALLAAVLPNPRRWSPARPTAYIAHRAAVIGQLMVQMPGKPGDPCS